MTGLFSPENGISGASGGSDFIQHTFKVPMEPTPQQTRIDTKFDSVIKTIPSQEDEFLINTKTTRREDEGSAHNHSSFKSRALMSPQVLKGLISEARMFAGSMLSPKNNKSESSYDMRNFQSIERKSSNQSYQSHADQDRYNRYMVGMQTTCMVVKEEDETLSANTYPSSPAVNIEIQTRQ